MMTGQMASITDFEKAFIKCIANAIGLGVGAAIVWALGGTTETFLVALAVAYITEPLMALAGNRYAWWRLRRRQALSAGLVLLLLCSTASAQVSFTAMDPGITPQLEAWKAENATGWWSWGVYPFDQNNDGKPDLYLAMHSTQGAAVFRQGTSLSDWSDVTAVLGRTHASMPYESRPVFADMDSDGWLDILATGDENATKNLRNSNTGTALIATKGDLHPVGGASPVLNAKGYPDFVASGVSGGKRYDYLFKSNYPTSDIFTYSKTQVPVPGDLPQAIRDQLTALESDKATANRFSGPTMWRLDLDRDGREDAVVSYVGSYSTPTSPYRFAKFLLRDQAGDLQDVTAQCGIPASVMPLAPFVDLTGDGLVDIVCGYGTTAVCGLYVQQPGGGVFVKKPGSIDKSVYSTAASYVYRLTPIDFDKDGDLDLCVDGRRLGWLDVHENKGGGAFSLVARLKHADADGAAIVDIDADGMTDIVTFGSTNHSDVTVAIYRNASPSKPKPTQAVLPLPTHDTKSANWARYVKAVDRDLTEAVYGVTPYDHALVYAVSKDERHAAKAMADVDAVVSAAEAKIAAAAVPDIAGNQYLGVGPTVRDISATYAWCPVPDEKKRRWAAFCQQAVWNVWNNTKAEWGGKPFPWPGWSVNNPGNNYHHSFLIATAYWAIASGDKTWLDDLRSVRLPALTAYYLNTPGGGSLEGTGYGESHRTLFELALLCRDGMGIEILPPGFAAASILYWTHATCPGFTDICPIGDHTRAHGKIDGYHRHLMRGALELAKDAPESSVARWWLANVAPSTNPLFFRFELADVTGEQSPPSNLDYHATGVGHFFARTSWQPDAKLLYVTCGPYLEAHAAQDQGGFGLWDDGWKTVTQNRWSRTGILQATQYQNVLRFVDAEGATVPQKFGKAAMSVASDPAGVTCVCDLSAVHDPAKIKSWTRTLRWDRGNRIELDDAFTLGTGITATQQVQVPAGSLNTVVEVR